MSVYMPSRRLLLGLAISLGVALAGSGRADTVDASSTTLLLVHDQARNGTLYTVAPVYEILSVSARDVQNPVAEDLQLVFSGWGAASLGSNLVWYDTDAPAHHLFGDVDLAYVQGEFLKRGLQLRLGRQQVFGGVTGAMQLDGGNVLVRLPAGFGISGYVGSPVSQRFDARGSENTWNPHRGNFAVGGRAYWVLPPWAEIGFSAVDVMDRGDPSRRQIGADLRITPWRPLTLLANTSYDLDETRWAETNFTAQYQLLPQLLASADYRHVEPDLLLPRDSILAVFAVDRRNEVGGSLQYDPLKTVTVVVDYHYLRQDTTADGHRANARVTWRPLRDTTVGAEIGKLRALDSNGYFLFRAFGSKQFDRVSATLDLQEYAFQQTINGQQNSLLATATAGYRIGGGWSALVSGAASATPYYDRRFDILAKLVYSQTYQSHEVR